MMSSPCTVPIDSINRSEEKNKKIKKEVSTLWKDSLFSYSTRKANVNKFKTYRRLFRRHLFPLLVGCSQLCVYAAAVVRVCVYTWNKKKTLNSILRERESVKSAGPPVSVATSLESKQEKEKQDANRQKNEPDVTLASLVSMPFTPVFSARKH